MPWQAVGRTGKGTDVSCHRASHLGVFRPCSSPCWGGKDSHPRVMGTAAEHMPPDTAQMGPAAAH